VEDLIALIVLGAIVEWVVSKTRKFVVLLVTDPKKTEIVVCILSIMTGVYYSLQTGRSILMSMGLSVKWPVADILVTGLLVGAAGGAWHELIAILKAYKLGQQIKNDGASPPQ